MSQAVRHYGRPQLFFPQLSRSFSKFIITLRLLLIALATFVSQNNVLSLISARFNFPPRPIFTNLFVYYVNAHLISYECYAFDSSCTTEERKYSTCSLRNCVRYLHFWLCISKKFCTCSILCPSRDCRQYLHFRFSVFLGNDIQHATRVSTLKDTDVIIYAFSLLYDT